ncbi:hypothetical protein [Acaryochloris marina]|uniref:Chromosome segregation ATPase n=1 Tax=Acaryochloris marina (strain MBIC 11017) TaxID=329726 RepID=B0C4Q8_ACAM1|nr:hypothetical protein [Acaryochloris marina]ABW29941.1 conserved hypothetical protein [Acaryochloris marina MBIC11017]
MTTDSKANLIASSISSEAVPYRGASRFKFLKYWPIWGMVAIALSGGVSFGSYRLLLHQPAKPNCAQVFWPFASGSLRVYCAQEKASKQTLEDLFAAIALVDALDANHPLRPAINPLIEQWSTQALDLAEKAFHAGKLDRAIEYAQRIPAQTTAYKVVKERVEEWQQVWAEGEDIYKRAEAALNNEEWRKAYGIMIKLVQVDNRYWSGTQFDSMTEKIIVAQKDERKLVKAKRLMRRGGLENLSESLGLVQELISDSVYRRSARKTQNTIARKLITIAEYSLERRNYHASMDALQLIPQDTPVWTQAQDFMKIAQASASAWNGTIVNLEEAINQASKLDINSPLYGKAQTLISHWQQEITNIQLLQTAQMQAQTGDIGDLTSAVAQAQQISSQSDRWQEAQQEIDQWQSQIQFREDQPILDRADQLALQGGPTDLQAAIAEAQRIRPGRALYDEAQLRISDWQYQLQPPESTPLDEPLQTVPTNGPDQLLKSAETIASQGTPKALAAAIEQANQIAPESPAQFQAKISIDNWSEQLLDMARGQALADRDAAIAIAQKIPSNSRVYDSAQLQIQTWQQQE